MLSVVVGEIVARRTLLRTGGACGAWVVAHDVAGVAEVVADCRAADWKVTIVGAGTRTAFRDGPIDGAVLSLGTEFCKLGEDWSVGAAFPMPALVGAAARLGRTGLERFGCVPGSVGGSLLHDPGWEEIVDAVSIVRRGKAIEVDLDEARAKKPIVLGARLRLVEDDPAATTRRSREVWTKQKPVPCGSWYDGPRKGTLRAALRSVRLPLVRLRDVAIPDAAPELLVNLGGGTATDLILLHKSALERVSAVQGDEFRSRIRWVGGSGA